MANRLDFHHHGGFRSLQAFRHRRNLAEQLVEFLGRAGSAVEMQGGSKGRRLAGRSPQAIPLDGGNRRPRRRRDMHPIITAQGKPQSFKMRNSALARRQPRGTGGYNGRQRTAECGKRELCATRSARNPLTCFQYANQVGTVPAFAAATPNKRTSRRVKKQLCATCCRWAISTGAKQGAPMVQWRP